MRTRFRRLSLVLLVLLGLVVTLGAATPQAKPAAFKASTAAGGLSAAPLNPQFVRYQAEFPLGAPQWIATGMGFGERPAPMDFSYARGLSIQKARDRSYPSSYDLRMLNKVTSVKDQGSYGTCWSFAALGSLESGLMPGQNLDFSEDNMVLTSGFDPNYATTAADLYDAGGNIDMATAYLVRWSGPVYESDDAYGDSYTPPGLVAHMHVQNVSWAPARSSSTDNDNIKYLVTTYGGVYVSMGFYGSSYGSSYYNATTHSYYCNDTSATDHGVLIVGWDDNYAASNFATTPPGNGAFIVKNSWGASWGESGYFYVSYYDTTFGRSAPAGAFNGAQPTSNYSRIYQYDPLGMCDSLGYTAASTGWIANVFTAQATDSLSAVGLYAGALNTSYQVWAGPSLASLTLRTSGTLATMGYHTVTLPAAVAVTSGQPFVVAAKLTTPGYNYPMPLEEAIAGYSDAATAQAGQSYISPNGTSWSDLTAIWDSTANVCLKAYTGTVAPAPTVTSFTPASGPVGTSVTVTGSGFTGATAVSFNGIAAATFSVASDTQITATVPAGATTGPIAVTTPGGSASSAASFTVTVPAVVSPTLTLKLSGLKSGAMRLGKSVTAKGTVTPTSLAGEKVTLTVQKKKGAKWVKVKSHAATINAGGAYSWKYKPAKRGAYRLQVTIAKTATHTTAKTKWFTFKVK
jgi:C1A family cysteine protease